MENVGFATGEKALSWLKAHWDPTTKIPVAEWRATWKSRERSALIRVQRIYFGTFSFMYAIHFHLVDIPLGKTPLKLWATYRFTMALIALLGFALTYVPRLMGSSLARVPLALFGILCVFCQDEATLWRPQTPHIYVILLACFATVALRCSVLQSLSYLAVNYLVSIPVWIAHPAEFPHLLSAALLGVVIVVIVRSRMTMEIDAFLSDQHNIETQKLLLETERQLSRIARQVAHDIGSPLSALNIATDIGSELPAENRVLIQAAAARIREIVESLQTSSISSGVAVDRKTSAHSLISTLDSILREKILEYISRPDISIQWTPSREKIRATFVPAALKRAISNLINNSVEALPEGGSIQVRVEALSENVAVFIEDNGVGIPPEVLPRLTEPGFTFGKKTGHGLGLHHARTEIESWGGKLEISSRLGHGTVVKISVRTAPEPGPERRDENE